MGKIETGHEFLARLGKKILRPGGKKGTKFLLKNVKINKDSKILEVACNRGETLIFLYDKYNCEVVGLDNNEVFVGLAKENLERKNLTDKIKLILADAKQIPFPDNYFDIIINQAMLTMIKTEELDSILKEYYRVLKPGGVLLTHDLAVKDDEGLKLINELRNLVKVPANPKTFPVWQASFTKNGFNLKKHKMGKMTLINIRGLFVDEGFNTFRILKNGLKKENRPRFLKLSKFFNGNRKHLRFLCLVNQKPLNTI